MSAPTSSRVARGAGGAGLASRGYRRSPLRRLVKVTWAHRGLRPDDVFIASYPRSGSAWLRFLLLEMLAGEASFARAAREVPYVGAHRSAPQIVPGGGRLIKTHEQYLDRYRRAIHLVRDPRDVSISYFHFLRRIGKITFRPDDDEVASFDRHVDAFLAGRVDAHGTWQSHALTWWRAAEQGRGAIVRVRYEDLRQDAPRELVRLGEWLGAQISSAEATGIAERCSLERMQAAEARALDADPPLFNKNAVRTRLPLVRSGTAGAWRTTLTADQQARFDVFDEGLALMGYPLSR